MPLFEPRISPSQLLDWGVNLHPRQVWLWEHQDDEGLTVMVPDVLYDPIDLFGNGIWSPMRDRDGAAPVFSQLTPIHMPGLMVVDNDATDCDGMTVDDDYGWGPWARGDGWQDFPSIGGYLDSYGSDFDEPAPRLFRIWECWPIRSEELQEYNEALRDAFLDSLMPQLIEYAQLHVGVLEEEEIMETLLTDTERAIWQDSQATLGSYVWDHGTRQIDFPHNLPGPFDGYWRRLAAVAKRTWQIVMAQSEGPDLLQLIEGTRTPWVY